MISRIERLKNRYLSRKPEICIERALLITEAYEELADQPPALLRAYALQRILERMTIYINEDELIVGNQSTKPRCAPVFPEFSCDWILHELDQFDKRIAGEYYITEENKNILREILPKWNKKTTKDRALTLIPQESREAMANQVFILTPLSSGLGHITVDYKKIINMGLEAIIDDLESRLARFKHTSGEELDKEIFYQSCIIVCKAMVTFAKRYADLARMLALSASGRRKSELLSIADVCEHVPRYPARNFHEALQSFWFLHLCLQIESNGHSMSPGRFDQYIFPAYKSDKMAGVSDEYQQELLSCLWVKFNEVNKLRDKIGSLAFGGYPMFQNLIVGGVDKDGKDCTNELSILCCKVTRDIKLPQPSLSVRWHKNSTKELMIEAAEVARCGTGMPAYFNDEIIIPILLKVGCTLEDARDYAEVGCVEPQPGGRCEGMYSAGFYSFCKALEITLYNGVNPTTGKKVGIETGKQFETFEQFYKAYLKQQQYLLSLFAKAVNAVDYVHSIFCPTPLVSCFVEDCIVNGMDIRRGGARYNFTSPNAVGLANIADSMAVIEQKVFRESKYTIDQLREILSKNYEGFENIRQEFINAVPKYGNDNDEVDQLCRRIGEDFCLEFKKHKNIRNGSYQPGLQSISAHALFVGTIGATPDGRKIESLVSDGGVSPSQGRDRLGPTAVIKSVSKLNHLDATNGALLNIKFHPTVVKGEKGLMNIKNLVDSFFIRGGQHVQFNIVSAETLRDAQKNPEKYGDLVVRVAGFSVLFTTLDIVLQNDIIERTEHTC